MNNVNELLEIIEQLGGSATTEQICYVYLKRHKMLIDVSYLAVIENTLNDNLDKVHKNAYEKWEILDKESPKELKHNINNNFFGFDFKSKKIIENSNYASELIKNFINEYPINKIKDLTIDEYAICPKGYGNNLSFCRQLRYDLNYICSMGNAFPATFELYKKDDGLIYLSPTYERMFGNDYNKAFEKIKDNIVLFLDAASKKDTKKMNEIQLNAAFRYKMACVYFSEYYYPGAVKEYFRQSCARLGVIFDDKNIFNNMIELSNWKFTNEETKNITNDTLMRYTDYLIRNDLSMSSYKINENPYRRF